MEYSNETEKLAFGFGTDKIAGNGKITELMSVKKEKSDRQEIAELLLSIVAVAGITFFKLQLGKKSKKKHYKKR